MDGDTMISEDDLANAGEALRAQKKMLRSALLKNCEFPDWAADETIDLAYHAADQALLTAIRIVRTASEPKVGETAFSVAMTLIGTAADGAIELAKHVAEKNGSPMVRVPNEP